MDASLIGLLLIAALLLCVVAGIPIAIALILLSFVGIWQLRGSAELAESLLATSAYASVSDYVFVAIPLFVLMGVLVSEADIGRDTYVVLEGVFRRVKGGLGVATVVSNALFGAVTGISIASASVFAKIAVPEMTRHGYRDSFAVGAVAGSSILGMLVPPSLLLIIYGVLAEQSIGQLFIAAIMPAMMMAGAFSVLVLVMAGRFPKLVFAASHVEVRNDVPDRGRIRMITNLVPVVGMAVIVLGGIYTGFFSPTEAGAAGALCAALVALARKKLTARRSAGVLAETALVSASILFLLVAASMYGRMLTFSGLPRVFAQFLTGLGVGYWSFLLILGVAVFIAGMFIDSVSMLLIFLPIVLPVATALGIDLIHFGVIMTIAVEMGLISPPFGLSVFVVHSTLNEPSITVGKVFLGTSYFLIPMIVVLAAVALFPGTTRILL